MIPKKFDLHYCKDALLRRKWYIIVPIVLIFSSGIIYAVTTPKIYKADTMILVQRQQVPSSYVRSNITTSLGDRINTIQQQVTSRTNLESLIKRLGLYVSKDSSEQEATMQDKVERMRRHIGIQLHRSAAFSISFTGTNSRKVAEIANALALNFVDEHLKVREQQSIGTTRFLESELARVETILREKEAALTAYKKQHMGGLPEDLDTNLRIMEQLNQKVSSLEQRLDEARTQKIMLEQQIVNLKGSAAFASVDDDEQDIFASEDVTDGSGQLHKLREQLKALRLSYTDNYPDVVKVKKIIEQIEENQEQEEAQGPLETPFSEGDSIMTAQQEVFEFQLASLQKTIRDLQSEKAKIEKQIGRLKERIDDTPNRKLTLISLQRDYNTIKGQYDSLLGKKLQSELAENLEKRQKGEQFIILDPARAPEKPFSPNVPRIILMTLLGALAASFGLAFTVEYLDESFRDFNDLAEFLQIPVLAFIPWLQTTTEVRRRHRLKVFAYCLSGCLLVAVCIGVFLWLNGDLQGLVQRIRSLV